MRRVNPQARPKAKPRRTKARRANPRWRRLGRQVAWGGLGLSVLGLVGGLVWLWHIGWYAGQAERLAQATLDWSAELGLKVEDVLVAGRERTRPEEILKVLEIDRGLPILGFDPHRAQERLERLPWVAHAEVERRLPGLVYVHLSERRPMAVWQLEGVYSVIDESGAVIPGADANLFSQLPQVVGPGAPEHTAELLKLLRLEPELQRLVGFAVRVGERRWNLQLADGIDVKLPEENAHRAWTLLAQMVREQGLLARDITQIDLRMPDRLIVRSRPEAASETDT